MFAVATTLQHRAAGQAESFTGGGTRDAGRALAGVFARPLWLAGLVADVLGFAMHAYALTAGELAVVQPLLVTGLLFALPLGARLDNRRVSRTQLGWAGAVVIALGVFLALARPSGGASTPELGPAAVAATGSLVLIVAFLVAAGTSGAGRRAAWLGAVTGLLFGLTAALVKAVGSQLSSGVLPALGSWPLYALLVIGPAGLLINQVAFQAGPLAASLPAITAVDPVASIVLGLLLFDERLHGRPLAATVEGIALAVLAVAVVRLARTERDPPVLPQRTGTRPNPASRCFPHHIADVTTYCSNFKVVLRRDAGRR